MQIVPDLPAPPSLADAAVDPREPVSVPDAVLRDVIRLVVPAAESAGVDVRVEAGTGEIFTLSDSSDRFGYHADLTSAAQALFGAVPDSRPYEGSYEVWRASPTNTQIVAHTRDHQGVLSDMHLD